jgi:hypothetical protein
MQGQCSSHDEQVQKKMVAKRLSMLGQKWQCAMQRQHGVVAQAMMLTRAFKRTIGCASLSPHCVRCCVRVKGWSEKDSLVQGTALQVVFKSQRK